MLHTYPPEGRKHLGLTAPQGAVFVAQNTSI
jgi:hypothetical protein